ncbi:hypothetical protein R5R35_004151 [Gryllus longicercus]|uniref:Uncharacterized protein n=1 Tax=Gryllus longicercus TaxID=2509291 RepID=A0AAN9V8P4_9ORTH
MRFLPMNPLFTVGSYVHLTVRSSTSSGNNYRHDFEAPLRASPPHRPPRPVIEKLREKHFRTWRRNLRTRVRTAMLVSACVPQSPLPPPPPTGHSSWERT